MMAKAKMYRMDLGHQTLVGPLTKLQAIQRAMTGVQVVGFRCVDHPDQECEFVYVLPDDGSKENHISVGTLDHRLLTEQQFRQETTPRIAQQPLGQEVF